MTNELIDNLIKRLETATEGSAELDARLQAAEYDEVFVKLDDSPRGRSHPRDDLSVCWIAENGRRYTCWRNKAYTRSLDAALTLVPEGYDWGVAWPKYGLGAFARVKWSLNPRLHAHRSPDGSPALALCIAALKAREWLLDRKADSTGVKY